MRKFKIVQTQSVDQGNYPESVNKQQFKGGKDWTVDEEDKMYKITNHFDELQLFFCFSLLLSGQ